MESCGEGNHWEQVSTSQRSERTASCLPARAPVGGERTARFTDSESDVRHSEGVRGGAPSGDFWSRIRLWKAAAKGITGSRCQPARGPVGGERTAYCLPARAPVGGHRTAASPAIFGLELDCGKLRQRESLGAGVSQPEDPWEVRERLSVYQPEHPWEVRERLLHSLFKGCRPCRRPRILRSGFSSTGWHCEGFSNRGFSRPFKGCSSGIVVSFRCRGRCPCGAFHCLLSGL